MRNLKTYSLITGFFLLLACSPNKKEASEEGINDIDEQMQTPDGTFSPAEVFEERKAVAELQGASNSDVSGTVKFSAAGVGKVKIEVEIENLSPGKHAMHLHQNGDCSTPDASSAGGHWNPTNKKHGKMGEGQYHKGDIINLEAGDDGKVSWSDEIPGWTIGGSDSTSILNKAVIIHSGADDFTSQPSGDSGSRVACGVIEEE